MSRESDLAWAEKLEIAADRIDDGEDWLDVLYDVWTVRRAQEVRSYLAYQFHADGGSKYEDPGVDGVLAGLRDWAKDLRDHIALLDKIAARRAVEATS